MSDFQKLLLAKLPMAPMTSLRCPELAILHFATGQNRARLFSASRALGFQKTLAFFFLPFARRATLTTVGVLVLMAGAGQAVGDLVTYRDTIDTAIVNGTRFELTSDFTSATPALSLGTYSFDWQIQSITVLVARGATTNNYDSSRFLVGQALSTDLFRTEAFGHQFYAGLPYQYSGQVTGGLYPDDIQYDVLPGRIDRLTFNNLSLQVTKDQNFDLLFNNYRITGATQDNYALVFSSGSEYFDRFDKGNVGGGLIFNVLVPLPNDDFAIVVKGTNAVRELGDVNLDGSVDLLDVAPFVNRISTGTFQAEADINQDGSVDLLDVQPFIDLLTG